MPTPLLSSTHSDPNPASAQLYTIHWLCFLRTRLGLVYLIDTLRQEGRSEPGRRWLGVHQWLYPVRAWETEKQEDAI